MILVVRLYWQHDLDLVALAANPEFNMSGEMKKMIRACADGDEYFQIMLPPPPKEKTVLDKCVLHIYFHPEKDKEAIAFLKKFRYGYRNSGLKNLFRKYLEEPYMDPYFNSELYESKRKGKNPSSETSVPKVRKKPKKKKKRHNPEQEPRMIPKQEEKIVQREPEVKREEEKHNEYKEQTKPAENPVLKNPDNPSRSDDDFDIFGAISGLM